MRVLRSKGVLENAIVVVLSDHGEALGWQTDSMLRKTGTEPRDLGFALGSWHERHEPAPVQRAARDARHAAGARLPARRPCTTGRSSLEDVRPTLEELVTGKAPGDVDGISLLPYLARPRRAPDARGAHPLYGNGLQYDQDAGGQDHGLRCRRRGCGLLRDRTGNRLGAVAPEAPGGIDVQETARSHCRGTRSWRRSRAGPTAR